MSEWKGGVRARMACAVVVTGSLWACGGSTPTELCPPGTTGSPPNCTPIPPPCTQSQVLQESGGIPSRVLVFDDFSVPEAGRLDLSLDWTNASSPMGLYLTQANTCTLEEFNARRCTFLVQVEPGRPKPVKASANVAAGNYRWLIGNFATTDESVSLQVVLSKGSSCPAHAGGTPSASDRPTGEPAALDRAQPMR